MKAKAQLFLVLLAFASSACNPSGFSVPLVGKDHCDPQDWKIAVTSVVEQDEGDGTKLVIAKLGVENNSSRWGQVHVDDTNTVPFVLTTKDGSTYEATREPLPIPGSPHGHSGGLRPPLLPPGFSSLGVMFDGDLVYWHLKFLIPVGQVPETLEISKLRAECILDPDMSSSGRPMYSSSVLDLPPIKYNLATDVQDIHSLPPASKFPDLVGSKIDLPDGEGTLQFTSVSQEGTKVKITFDVTNLSSGTIIPAFAGYVVGNLPYHSCTSISDEQDCSHGSADYDVAAGETKRGLNWTFTIPENETDLMLVYAYSSSANVNEVFRLNP